MPCYHDKPEGIKINWVLGTDTVRGATFVYLSMRCLECGVVLEAQPGQVPVRYDGIPGYVVMLREMGRFQ